MFGNFNEAMRSAFVVVRFLGFASRSGGQFFSDSLGCVVSLMKFFKENNW